MQEVVVAFAVHCARNLFFYRKSALFLSLHLSLQFFYLRSTLFLSFTASCKHTFEHAIFLYVGHFFRQDTPGSSVEKCIDGNNNDD